MIRRKAIRAQRHDDNRLPYKMGAEIARSLLSDKRVRPDIDHCYKCNILSCIKQRTKAALTCSTNTQDNNAHSTLRRRQPPNAFAALRSIRAPGGALTHRSLE